MSDTRSAPRTPRGGPARGAASGRSATAGRGATAAATVPLTDSATTPSAQRAARLGLTDQAGVSRRAAAPPLRVVPPARRRPAARAPFMLLIAGLLTAGLLCLLMLNTVLAEGAFVLDRLEVRSNALTDTEQALEQKLAITSSPQELTKRATAMGMVPSTNPVFIRASDGKILGVPEAGKKPTPAPEAKPQPKPAASVPQPAASPAPRAATDTEAQ